MDFGVINGGVVAKEEFGVEFVGLDSFNVECGIE